MITGAVREPSPLGEVPNNVDITHTVRNSIIAHCATRILERSTCMITKVADFHYIAHQNEIIDMALVNSILQYSKPPEWDQRTYNNVRFVRIPLDSDSTEYDNIRSEFLQKFGVDYNIIRIERVQHPYAYARFKIRREHLITLNRVEPTENRQYFPIVDDSAIDKILEFNCDPRRGGYNTVSSLYSSAGYVLAVKTFLNFNFDTRDTHRYPEYLIQYGGDNKTCPSPSTLPDDQCSLNNAVELLTSITSGIPASESGSDKTSITTASISLFNYTAIINLKPETVNINTEDKLKIRECDITANLSTLEAIKDSSNVDCKPADESLILEVPPSIDTFWESCKSTRKPLPENSTLLESQSSHECTSATAHANELLPLDTQNSEVENSSVHEHTCPKQRRISYAKQSEDPVHNYSADCIIPDSNANSWVSSQGSTSASNNSVPPSSPTYNPICSGYAPTSPLYMGPASPSYSPFSPSNKYTAPPSSPTSPTINPCSPVHNPTSPSGCSKSPPHSPTCKAALD